MVLTKRPGTPTVHAAASWAAGLSLGDLGPAQGGGSSLNPLLLSLRHPQPRLHFSSSPEMLLQERAWLTPPVPVYLEGSAAVFPN